MDNDVDIEELDSTGINSKSYKNSYFTWPGTNYLGPGNPVLSGSGLPTSDADWTALEHDIEYTEAKNYNDILKSDNKAIRNFKSGSGLQNFAGSVGLQAKQGAESIFGPIYPFTYQGKDLPYNNPHSRNREDQFMSNQNVQLPKDKHGRPFNQGNLLYAKRQSERAASKRAQAAIASTSTSNKKAKTASNMENNEKQMEVSDDPMEEEFGDANVNQVNGGNSGAGGKVPKGTAGGLKFWRAPVQANMKCYINIAHVHYFTTWAYAWKRFPLAIPNPNTVNNALIATSMAVLPVNMNSFYMPESTYNQLPLRSRAIDCNVKVFPIGFRSSFGTGATDSTWANSNHSIFGVRAIGLNKNRWITHRKYPESDSMVVGLPEDLTAQDLTDRMWGGDSLISGQAAWSSNFPTVYGVHRTIRSYAVLVQPLTTATQENPGWPMNNDDIEQFDFPDAILAAKNDFAIHNYSYKFHNGVLKEIDAMFPENGNSSAAMAKPRMTTRAMTRNTAGRISAATDTAVPALPITPDTYGTLIEKHGMNTFDHNQGKQDQQPLIYFGLMPIQSNTPNEPQTYTNCSGFWRVHTNLTVEMNFANLCTLKRTGHLNSISNIGQATGAGNAFLNSTRWNSHY